MSTLLPHHAALITDSAISPEVAVARGYRSVVKKAELRELGFGVNQARVPALLIPIWGISGEIALYQARPDDPRIIKGKPTKYETPAKCRMVVDVPPGIRAKLADPSCPLFITEGVRKADAAVSKGLCCVALLGVWNWRGSNELGGRLALPEWDSMALNGRTVYIVFDSDVMKKLAVHQALVRLKALLEARSAEVALVYLKEELDGQKLGLDDFFAAGHDVQDLLVLSRTHVASSSPNARQQGVDTGPYQVESGRICFEKGGSEGTTLVSLCNFTAQVREEVVLDDGAETSRAFVIDGELENGAPLPTARVSVAKFGCMNWVAQEWGVRAQVFAGQATRDRLRDAIQRFSAQAGRRTIYTHTGWRRIDGRWAFLSAAGAIGADAVEVDLGEGLQRYSLPTAATDPVNAMRQSLALLHVAPLSVTAALWGAIFRAPLIQCLPCDVSLWLEGVTGSLKSTLAALFLCHFGLFERTTLPGSWVSTANLLERRAFTLKDSVFVIDDFAPNDIDGRELNAKAARLLRAQGNRAGRGRLQADLTERPELPPRGLIVGTGEDRPTGRSILARTLLLELDRSVVNMERLTTAQRATSHLAHALAGYVRWLVPQMDALPSIVGAAFREGRTKAASAADHLRIPEAMAHLCVFR